MLNLNKTGVALKVILVFISTLIISTLCLAKPTPFEYLPDAQVIDIKPQMVPAPVNGVLYDMPFDNIKSLLENVLLFDDMDQYEALPYIVGFDKENHLGGRGEIAYVMGIDPNSPATSYSLLYAGKVFVDPIDESEIGLEVNVVGTAEIVSTGTPQIIKLIDTRMPIEAGMRLTPQVGFDVPSVLNAQYPARSMQGVVLAFGKDFFGGGDYSLVAVNLGTKDGLVAGSVLDLVEGYRSISDRVTDDEVSLPTEKFGEILIYKPGEKISLGIVTNASRMVLENDIVRVVPSDYSVE